MNKAEFEGLIRTVEQQVYQSASFYGLYWAHVGKPKFDEMIELFEAKPHVFAGISLSAKLAMVVTIRKFFDDSRGVHGYPRLLKEAKKRQPRFSDASLDKIVTLRNKLEPWHQDIRILRNRIYAHSDPREFAAEVTSNNVRELIIGMGELFSHITVELGGRKITPEAIIEESYNEALSLWNQSK